MIGKRRLIVSSLVFLLLLTLHVRTVTVYAGENGEYHPDVRCSLTIELENPGTRPEHTLFDIYQVGTSMEEGTLRFQLLDVYRETGIDLNEIKLAEEQEKAAGCLNGVLDENTLVRRVGADTQGVIHAGNLEQGVYLVKQKDSVDYGKVAPFLVFLPYGMSGKWEYDLTVSPKAEWLEEEKASLETQRAVSARPIATGDTAVTKWYAMLSGGMLCVMILVTERKFRK